MFFLEQILLTSLTDIFILLSTSAKIVRAPQNNDELAVETKVIGEVSNIPDFITKAKDKKPNTHNASVDLPPP